VTALTAKHITKGDVVLLGVGWRNVLDVWESLGFTHVVASDATGMWLNDEEVEVGRRPQPPKGEPPMHARRGTPRTDRHDRGEDCGYQHCVACWRAGRRESPVLGASDPRHLTVIEGDA
jgi:hypothetical protein